MGETRQHSYSLLLYRDMSRYSEKYFYMYYFIYSSQNSSEKRKSQLIGKKYLGLPRWR